MPFGIQYADIKEKCYYVTDSGANIKSAFRQLLLLPCSCHINTFKSLNNANIVLTEFDESGPQEDLVAEEISSKEKKDEVSFFEYSSTLKKLITSCKDLVAHFNPICTGGGGKFAPPPGFFNAAPKRKFFLL